MTTPHDKALKPCPFCGSPAEQDYMRGYAMYPSGKPDHGAAIYRTACNADMMICREDMPELSNEERMAILEENWNRRAESFNCKARQQGSAGGNTPADCDWPVCGCDPAADRVIASLEESGILASPLHAPIEAVNGGEGWIPIDRADKSIDRILDFTGMPRPIGHSEEYWVRDRDGRIYQAAWADDGRKAYWWDLEGESPVDPVDFMPHPLDCRFASTPSNEGREKA